MNQSLRLPEEKTDEKQLECNSDPICQRPLLAKLTWMENGIVPGNLGGVAIHFGDCVKGDSHFPVGGGADDQIVQGDFEFLAW